MSLVLIGVILMVAGAFAGLFGGPRYSYPGYGLGAALFLVGLILLVLGLLGIPL